MRVLVACEYSGRVRDEFQSLGHEALSCDMLPTDSPGNHYQGDVRDVLYDGWDMLVGHPPCTYLSVSGMHWTARGLRDPNLTEDALDFVRLLMDAPIKHIAIENPVSVISTRIRKPDQVVQPWQFGHDASKKTCLWLKNLPLLQPTLIVQPHLFCCGVEVPDGCGDRGCANCCGDNKAKERWGNQTPSGQNKLGPSEDRWKIRSETYKGLAQAMAMQWSKHIETASRPDGALILPTQHTKPAQSELLFATAG